MRVCERERGERMGKGRAPCCDKTKVKRGPWSQDEDLKLISFIHKFGHENWRSLPKQAGMFQFLKAYLFSISSLLVLILSMHAMKDC